MRSRRLYASLICVAIALTITFFVVIPRFKASVVRANRLDLEAMARKYPNFSAAQRLAVLREMQSQWHPAGRDMTLADFLNKLAALADASGSGLPPAANFMGNLTSINSPAVDIMALAQQPDCSLTLRYAPYSLLSGPLFSYTTPTSTPDYGNVLHSAAGLTTTPGKFPPGCGNTNTGATSRKIVFAGITTSGVRVYAGHFYNVPAGEEAIYTVTAKADDTFQTFNTLTNTNTAVDLLTSDLNGDGNGDLISINSPATSGSATVTVFLGKADGSFPTPTEITLPGNIAISGVIDDFNGDGKKDLVVATSTGLGGAGTTYYINFLAGKGDGTFQAVQSYTETPPSIMINGFYFGLISADLRSSGHKDLITSAGIVLFGNGNGTFTQSSTAAFPASAATSSYGPNVAAADFNKDGKPDLALDNGASIQIYLGKGDGTFTPGAAYSTINNVGYLVAQDVDGDGNVDLYSGTGNNGTLGGDQFDLNMGYALMGNGDGTFHGAPSQLFSYTGTNLGDLNGDKNLDAVGVNADSSLTSYLGDGKGNFATGATLVTSPITLSGTKYTFNSGLDSYSVGDINGDGVGDLVYIATNFYGPNYAPGIFIALGKGDGSFEAPTFMPTPAFVAPPDIDVNPTLNGVRLADMNHDGKLDLVYIYNTASYKQNKYFEGIAVQLGNGDGTFKTTSQLTQLYSGATAANPGAYQLALIADVNKDSNADLFVLSGLSLNSPSLTLQTYLGKGDGTFNAPTTVAGVNPPSTLYGTQSVPIALEDMNGDGSPDIVALEDDANTQNLDIAIALGNGDGTFKAPVVTNYAGQYVNGTGLAVADFNGDGKLDVATTSFLGPMESGIAFGNGDGTLQTSGGPSATGPVQVFYVGAGGAAVALDLNGDGKPDILSGPVELLSQASSGGTVASTTSLLTSASSIYVGQSITFTASVAGPSGNTTVPTGNVSFNNGTTVLGSSALDVTGTATLASSSLAAGNYNLTAVYSGDSTFASSTSPAIPLTVTAGPPPDFGIALAQAGTTVPYGTAATVNDGINVTSMNGFNQPVTLACSGAPQFASCSVKPASVTPSGGTPGTSTLNIMTDISTASAMTRPLPPSDMRGTMALAFLGGGAIFAFTFLKVRRIHSQFVQLCLLACLLAGTALIGCGGSSSSNNNTNNTPKGTYKITVTATAGSITHSGVFNLTIQ
jgi:Bacterial Ig-like domain (group 3)/FG-GAP-like repeat